MMRKFPKLLAVVLAIAILICPAINLTPMANTYANDYSITYDDAKSEVTVTVTAADPGFLVALLRVKLEGFTFDDDALEKIPTVETFPVVEEGFAANPYFNAETGILSLLLAAKADKELTTVNSATVTIPVTKNDNAETYAITLETLQAADAGTYDEASGSFTAPEALLVFDNVNTETGEIDVEAAGDKAVAIKPCNHEGTTVTYTANEDGATHKVVCECGEVIEASVPHVFDDDADTDCNFCDFTREVVTVCQHANKTFVEVAKVATAEEDGALKFHCADCDEDVLCAVEFDADLITFVTPAISCEATTILRLKTARTTSLNAYSNGVLVVKHNFQNGAAATTNSYNMSDLDLVSSRYQLDIPVIYTQFTDTFDCALYLEKDGVWYFNGGTPYSLRDVAMTYINGTTEEKFKYASANLLKVGAAAQNEFGYAKTNLADSELDGSQYVVDTTPAISSTEGVNFTGLPADYTTAGKVFYITPGVLLSDSTAITVKANKAYYTGAELNDLRLEYAYTKENGATKTGEITEFELDNRGRMLFTLDLDAPDMRSVITFKLYNGDTQVADDAVFSVEGALGSYYNNGQYTKVIERALIYSDVVALYF